MINQLLRTPTSSTGDEGQHDHLSVVRRTLATISLLLLPFAGATAQTDLAQEWRVDPEPALIDSYRKAMGSNPSLGVAVLKKEGKNWGLAPSGSHPFQAELLRDSSVEILAIDYDARFVRLLLAAFGKPSSHPSRMGYWCKGGLFGHKRKEHGYSMCTTEFSRSVTGGWATVTGVASLGQTIEYVAAIDPEAIRKVVRSINLDAHRNVILDSSARRGWALNGAGSQESGATTGRLSYPPELAERDEKIRRNLEAQRSTAPSTAVAQSESPSEARSGPTRIGDRICRTGRLDYTACFNPEFQSSCVSKSAYGQLQGYLEAFSPDSTRIQVRVARYAFEGGMPPMLAAYPTLDGISGQPNGVHWDRAMNWSICGW